MPKIFRSYDNTSQEWVAINIVEDGTNSGGSSGGTTVDGLNEAQVNTLIDNKLNPVSSQVNTNKNDISNIKSVDNTQNSRISTLESNRGTMANLATTDKTSLVNAINETFQSVSNGKTLVANAITDKGVATQPTDTFATMAMNISNIPAGSIDLTINDVHSPSVDKYINRFANSAVLQSEQRILDINNKPNLNYFYNRISFKPFIDVINIPDVISVDEMFHYTIIDEFPETTNFNSKFRSAIKKVKFNNYISMVEYNDSKFDFSDYLNNLNVIDFFTPNGTESIFSDVDFNVIPDKEIVFNFSSGGELPFVVDNFTNEENYIGFVIKNSSNDILTLSPINSKTDSDHSAVIRSYFKSASILSDHTSCYNVTLYLDNINIESGLFFNWKMTGVGATDYEYHIKVDKFRLLCNDINKFVQENELKLNYIEWKSATSLHNFLYNLPDISRVGKNVTISLYNVYNIIEESDKALATSRGWTLKII